MKKNEGRRREEEEGGEEVGKKTAKRGGEEVKRRWSSARTGTGLHTVKKEKKIFYYLLCTDILNTSCK